MPAERNDIRNIDGTAPCAVIMRETQNGKFQQEIIAGTHHLLADEPTDVAGSTAGRVRTICCLPHSAPARR